MKAVGSIIYVEQASVEQAARNAREAENLVRRVASAILVRHSRLNAGAKLTIDTTPFVIPSAAKDEERPRDDEEWTLHFPRGDFTRETPWQQAPTPRN
jgi:hypothetical protein